MDKSFSTSLFSNKSPFSPRSRQNASQKRSVAPSPFRKSSRFSMSGRSTQTAQIVLKTQQNTVERFGQPLPVLVTEALTFAERNTVVSARISAECGYAWLVCGRRLLIWQYKQPTLQHQQPGTPRRNTGSGGIANQCYELQLPQSDLAHRAELVSVFIPANNTFPACIAVSPEGVVRYWPSIVHEGMSIEQPIDLQGQECDSLTSIEGLGCILATTTCTVVLIQRTEAPRHALSCRTLKMPSGWLGGISKRMSSFIFGPITTETSAETRLVRVLPVQLDTSTWNVFVLAGHSLQKWKLSTEEAEEFVYVADLTRQVREGFNAIWESCTGDLNIESWILDLQPHANGVMLLAAGVNLPSSPQIYYALILVDTAQPAAQFVKFSLMKLSGLYSEENPAESLGYRFLYTEATSYIYNHRCITVMQMCEEPDCLEFNSPQDFLLGGSICVNTPVFFSRNFGLVAVTSNDDFNFSNVASPSALGDASYLDTTAGDTLNLTLFSFNPEELALTQTDVVGQLKAAFIYESKNQLTERNAILAEAFAFDDNHQPGIGAVIDRAVWALSNEILNDIPANDPRWSSRPVGLASSYAMQAASQLEEKQQTHALYVKFLRAADLWKRLGAVIVRSTPIATVYLLGENSERIVAAMALKARAHDNLLRIAIDGATHAPDILVENGLTKQNIFYCQVSTFHKVIVELVKHCDAQAHSDLDPAEVATTISHTNNIVLDVLKAVLAYRQTNAGYFEPSGDLYVEYCAWTGASGPEGLMDSLINLISLTLYYGARNSSEYDLQNALYEQLVALVDIVLDARKSHVQSVKAKPNEGIMLKQYAQDRKRLIMPLVDDKRWDGAATLAEKYLDFECLMIVCERTDNQARLDTYMERFKEEDFPTFVYNWHLQENKQGKLIELCNRKDAASGHSARGFLATQPSLAWIQNIFDGKFNEASAILNHLGQQEQDSLKRQKTMFSLAKLAALAAGENSPSFEQVNTRLELITYQEELPDYVLQHFGYDTLKPNVIPAKDLIHLYTCPEYKDATEVAFKKSLDLLNFVEEGESRRELCLGIWKDAVLRDRWDEENLDSPIEVLEHKLMFKVVDLALAMGADPKTLLPPLNSLLNHSDLVELQHNKSFEYLIRTGYEHINRIMGID